MKEKETKQQAAGRKENHTREPFVKKNRKQTRNQILGRLGEELAAGYLQQEGYEILCRNYRCSFGEIDVIARKDGIICFVEVKTRSTDRYGQPAEAVNREKQRRIRLTAAFFLEEEEYFCRGTEFQVMEILVRHHEGLAMREVGRC